MTTGKGRSFTERAIAKAKREEIAEEEYWAERQREEYETNPADYTHKSKAELIAMAEALNDKDHWHHVAGLAWSWEYVFGSPLFPAPSADDDAEPQDDAEPEDDTPEPITDFDDPDAFMKRTRVAELLGVNVSTLDRMCSRGDFLPPIRLPTGQVRFRAADVENWMLDKRLSATDHAKRKAERSRKTG